jgi:hypothetical protein
MRDCWSEWLLKDRKTNSNRIMVWDLEGGQQGGSNKYGSDSDINASRLHEQEHEQ